MPVDDVDAFLCGALQEPVPVPPILLPALCGHVRLGGDPRLPLPLRHSAVPVVDAAELPEHSALRPLVSDAGWSRVRLCRHVHVLGEAETCQSAFSIDSKLEWAPGVGQVA